MSENNTKMYILAGAGVLAAGALVYYMTKSSTPAQPAVAESTPTKLSKKKSKKDRKSSSKKAQPQSKASASASSAASQAKPKPSVSKETVLKVFEEITENMQQVVLQLTDVAQKFRQAAAQQGKPISDVELANYINEHFANQMQTIETQVYAKHKTTEEKVQKACEFLAEDKDYKRAASKLRATFSMITGQEPDPNDLPDLPADLTLSKVLMIMEATMDAVTKCMIETGAQVKKEVPAGNGEAFAIKFNQKLMHRVGAVQKEAIGVYNIGQDVWQAAIIKYQHSAEFSAKMIELQAKQKKMLSDNGLAMMNQ